MAGRTLPPNETRITELVRAIRELFQGRSHAVGEFTLTAGATSTVVTNTNCGEDSRIALTPRTANAAGALATTYIPVAAVIAGQFTVTHANAGTTDRTYGYAIYG